jgi:hypothetical protein
MSSLLLAIALPALLFISLALWASLANRPYAEANKLGYTRAFAVHFAGWKRLDEKELDQQAMEFAEESKIPQEKRPKWIASFKSGYSAGLAQLDGPYGTGFRAGIVDCKSGVTRPSGDTLDAMARQAVGPGNAEVYKIGYSAGWAAAYAY